MTTTPDRRPAASAGATLRSIRYRGRTTARILLHAAMIVLPLGLILSLLAAILAPTIMGHRVTRPRVYTVSELQATVMHAPGSWTGQIVLVRANATVLSIGACRAPSRPSLVACRAAWVLYDSPSSGQGYTMRLIGLTLVSERANPVATVLRQVPMIDRFVRPPQIPTMRGIGVYRIRIDSYHRNAVPPLRSIDASLLDAASGSIPQVPQSIIVGRRVMGLFVPPYPQ